MTLGTRTFNVLVVLAAIAAIPLTIAMEQAADDPLLTVADWLIWGIFLLDLTLVDRNAVQRRMWRRDPIGVAIVILTFPLLPPAFGIAGIARFSRVVRIIRLPIVFVRAARALRDVVGRPGLIYVAGLNVLMVLIGGAALDIIEPETVGDDIWNGVWWAAVTATTVGYGDIAPTSAAGRGIGVLLMLGGIGFVSALAGSVSAYFVGKRETDLEQELAFVRGELGNLKAQLHRIEDLLHKDSGN